MPLSPATSHTVCKTPPEPKTPPTNIELGGCSAHGKMQSFEVVKLNLRFRGVCADETTLSCIAQAHFE